MSRISPSHRRWHRPISVLAATVLGLLTFAAPASAHNVLISSDPAANAVLAKAPGRVTLVFDQDVQNIYAEMAVTIGSQAPVEISPTVDGRDVTADLSDEQLDIPAQSGLVPWRVGYRIVSADGHPVTGLVNFSVGPAAAGAAASTPAARSIEAASAPGSPGHVPWVVIGVGVLLLLTLATWGLFRTSRQRPTDR